MVPTLQDLGLNALDLEERLAVAEAIWDSVVREAEAQPLTAAQRMELEPPRGQHRPASCSDSLGTNQSPRSCEGTAVTLPVVLRAEAEAEFDLAFD